MVGNLVKIADLLVNKGVSIFDIIKILLLAVPSVLGFILPTGTLASVLLVFGNLAQNNELIAMKASGVNLVRVVLPVIAVAFLLSLMSLFLNDQVQPRAMYWYRQLIREMVVKRPVAYLDEGRFIKDFKGYILYINKIKGDRLEGVTIYQPQENKPTRTIMAEWGKILTSPDQQSLSLNLFNGTSDEPNPDEPSVFYKLNFKTFLLPNISLGEASGGKGKKPKEMTIDELIYQLQHDEEAKSSVKRHRELEAEIHKKISFSFATFVFVLIGLPAAAITRRGEAIVSFSVAMGIVAIYYVLFVWGSTMAVNGFLPPVVALWIPNFLLMGVAFFLGSRAIIK
jgi:LPS export ABC transporter permease LptF